MPNIGPMEIGIVLLIALIVFGPKRLPELGRGLGGGMREFKHSVTNALPPAGATETETEIVREPEESRARARGTEA